jgi:hypothetical protein
MHVCNCFEEMFQVMGISLGFVFRRYPVQLLARILTILTEMCGLPQFPQMNAGIIP